MSKEKQIEEMVELFLRNTPLSTISCEDLAELMYDSGYRKASKVAREIFEEIERVMSSLDRRYMASENPKQSWGVRGAMAEIAELKKKYAGEKT